MEDESLNCIHGPNSSNNPETSQISSSDSTSSNSLNGPEKKIDDCFIDEEAVYLVSRLESMNIALQQDAKVKTFEDIQERIKHATKVIEISPPERSSSAIDGGRDSLTDWQLWGRILGDYDGMVRSKPKLVLGAIKNGVPDRVRGLAWQQISQSKNSELEDTYRLLHKCPSPVEKLIQRDLPRTFPRHQHFSNPNGKGQTSLFQVMKTYSMYDPEVGYCQGLSFIVGCLVLCMPDEEAFCLLVKLMNGYNMRGMYSPRMEALQLRLYQFDRALADQLPEVENHFANEGIRSSMYASQWFLTLFAYRFPLPVVFRIMDVLLAEGFDFVFRVSIALIKRNVATVLKLQFEELIEYLKHGLFDVYTGNVTMLVNDAFNVRITKHKLDKWAKEYANNLSEAPCSAEQESERLKRDIRGYLSELKHLREAYEMIRSEYQTVQKRAQLLENSNRYMKDDVESLKLANNEYRHIFNSQVNEAEQKVASDMDAIAKKNKALSAQNVELKLQNEEMIQSVIDIKLQLAQLQLEKEELSQQLHSFNRSNVTSPNPSANPSANPSSPSPGFASTFRNNFQVFSRLSNQNSSSASNPTTAPPPSASSNFSFN